MKNEIILTNVKVGLLQHAFNRSLMLKNSDALNFSISSAKIASVTSDKRDAFFKKWELITSQICEFDQPFDEIKMSIIKGADFNKKLLGYFRDSESVTLVIEHIDGDGNKMTISNEHLTITLVLSPINLSYQDYPEATLTELFSPNDEAFTNFTLSIDELKRIRSLSGLSTNPETQTSFVSFYTKDGSLCVTDNAFDLKLHESSVEVDNVRLDKSMLGALCTEDYEIAAYHGSGDIRKSDSLVASSTMSNTVSAIILIEDIADAAHDEFDFSNSQFDWDNNDNEAQPY